MKILARAIAMSVALATSSAYNVQWMSRKLKELQEKGHPVDAEVLKVLSPYRREHINRFGDYLLDLQRPVPPLDSTIDFAFKSAA